MESSAKVLIRNFSRKLDNYAEEERKKILSALRWGEGLHHNQQRASGEPFIVHPLTVAEILVDAHLDYETVIAAILHDALEDTGLSPRELRKEYGREVEALVQGVTKISVIRGRSKTTQAAAPIPIVILDKNRAQVFVVRPRPSAPSDVKIIPPATRGFRRRNLSDQIPRGMRKTT